MLLRHWLTLVTIGLLLGAGLPAKSPEKPKFVVLSIAGRIVWLDEALARRFEIESDADAAHTVVALEANDGTLYPIVKDLRGRGFHSDPRLHELDLELLVRRYEQSPMVQVLRVRTIKPDGKFELDYWCDVCAIVMYELKQCECCQGPTRLRERPVKRDAGKKETGRQTGAKAR